MDANTATQPIAANGDSGLEAGPRANASGNEPLPVPSSTPAAPKTTAGQIAVSVLGAIAFLYFARPVVLPVVLACVAGMTLKPLIRWSSCCHIPPPLSAAVVLCFLVSALGVGFFQLGRPALTWVNEAPQNMNDLRQREKKICNR